MYYVILFKPINAVKSTNNVFKIGYMISIVYICNSVKRFN